MDIINFTFNITVLIIVIPLAPPELQLEWDIGDKGGMVALFGSVGELNEEKEEWQLCVKRMEHYMNTNEIQDERVMKYKQVLEQMAQHYCPKRSVIVERYTFHSHLRWKEEPIVAFVVKLREMTQTCCVHKLWKKGSCENIVQATIALEDVWLKGTQGTVKDRIRCVAEGDEAEKDSELSTVQQIYAVNNGPFKLRQFWPDQKLEEITGILVNNEEVFRQELGLLKGMENGDKERPNIGIGIKVYFKVGHHKYQMKRPYFALRVAVKLNITHRLSDATVTGKVQHIHRLMQMLGNKDSRRASCSLFSNCKGDICKSPRLACCHLLQDQPYSQTAHSCLQEQDSYLRPRRLYVQCQHEKKNRLYMHMYTYPDLLPSLPQAEQSE
eukprot:Em0007g1531a